METKRIFKLEKPKQIKSRIQSEAHDDLPELPAPAVGDEDDFDDEDDWNSDLDSEDLNMLSDVDESDEADSIGLDSENEDFSASDSFDSEESDLEAEYEAMRSRAQRERGSTPEKVHRLPVKTQSGVIETLDPRTRERETAPPTMTQETNEVKPAVPKQKRSNHEYEQRFDKPAPAAVLSESSGQSRKNRILAAKAQIASLSQEITSQDPELTLPLLRRLCVYSLPFIPTSHSQPKSERLRNEPIIRTMAHLSLTAVFIDIIPGYSIRPLSEQEKSETINQDLARRRDFEAGLVNIYKDWLKTLDADVKGLSDVLRSYRPFV